MKIYYEIDLSVLDKVIDEAAEIIAVEMHSNAVNMVPYDDGTLSNSIAFEIDKKDKSITLSANAPHAQFVEFGTGKRGDASWQPETGDTAEVKPTYNTSGVVEITRRHGEAIEPYERTFNGQESQPFIRPQVAFFKNNFNDAFIEAARKILKNQVK
jgi:HK97 gp10 family phage protein